MVRRQPVTHGALPRATASIQKVKPGQSEKIILGIDPGTTVTGYGLISVSGRSPSLITLGIIDLRKKEDHFRKIRTIFEETLGLIDRYHPDEFAIEAPFFGKNVQSMLKLGRAQGAAIAAALYRDLPVFEYAPRMIKMSITGRGQASKEQVASMLRTILAFHRSRWFLTPPMPWVQPCATSTRAISLLQPGNSGTGATSLKEQRQDQTVSFRGQGQTVSFWAAASAATLTMTPPAD